MGLLNRKISIVMDAFRDLDRFEDREEYWGIDELRWDWKSLFAEKETVTEVVDTTFALDAIGIRKHRVIACMEFKKVAESVILLFDKEVEFMVTPEIKTLVGELAALYKKAVKAYYGTFKVNVPGPEASGAVIALELPFGPWVLFSKIAWEDFLSGQRAIRMRAILAASKASSGLGGNKGSGSNGGGNNDTALDQHSDSNGASGDGGNGLSSASASTASTSTTTTTTASSGPSASGVGSGLGSRRPPRGGLRIDELEDEAKMESEDATAGRRPSRRVSFNLPNNNNSDRRRSRSRSRDRHQQARRSSTPPRRNRDRATESFDEFEFEDFQSNGPQSASV